ncbi:MAG TPA: EamA family transporter [Acidimicrobiales bacterium]|nr:EamA family transporter [Acidimicrobiales bacterium]
MSAARVLDRSPAVGLVGAGAISVQFGAAFATKLFGRVGPAGAVTLRLVVAAIVLLGVMAFRRPGRRAAMAAGVGAGTNPSAVADRGTGAADRAVAVTFGLVLAAMNLSFYESIARIPLGAAVTIEFTGPLCLALVASRRWLDGLWAAAAGAGVALLASGTGRHFDPVGLLFALIAGAFWVAYILLSKETGRRYESLEGLAWAMGVGALAVLPFGLAAGGTRLANPSVLGLGVAVGIMSSVVPYSLELMALRRVSARAFGVMMSLDPALATAAGFLILGQHLDLAEWIALALVVGANLGNSLRGSALAPTGAS